MCDLCEREERGYNENDLELEIVETECCGLGLAVGADNQITTKALTRTIRAGRALGVGALIVLCKPDENKLAALLKRAGWKHIETFPRRAAYEGSLRMFIKHMRRAKNARKKRG